MAGVTFDGELPLDLGSGLHAVSIPLHSVLGPTHWGVGLAIPLLTPRHWATGGGGTPVVSSSLLPFDREHPFGPRLRRRGCHLRQWTSRIYIPPPRQVRFGLGPSYRRKRKKTQPRWHGGSYPSAVCRRPTANRRGLRETAHGSYELDKIRQVKVLT